MNSSFQELAQTVRQLAENNSRVDICENSAFELSIKARGKNCVWLFDGKETLSVFYLEEFAEFRPDLGPNLRYKLRDKQAYLQKPGKDEQCSLNDIAEDALAFVLEPESKDRQT